MIPAPIRERAGLKPGTEIEVVLEDGSVRLRRMAPKAKLVRVHGRLIARPTADAKKLPGVDAASLIEEERSRWPS